MLSFDEAVVAVTKRVEPVGCERIGIFDARGRTLREDIVSPIDLPPFDHSAMDGYAVSTEGLGEGLHRLVVEGESSAGPRTAGPPLLRAGSAMRIFTGAMLPIGADAVVMQEDVTREGDDMIFEHAPRSGVNIRRRGEDLSCGAVAIASGSVLHAGRVALAATVGRASVTVSRQPVVTILGTGDELRSPGEPRDPGTIVESNGFFVKAEAERVGAVAKLAPFVRDEDAALDLAIEEALASTDLLVTIGGVSVGDRDLVRPALERAGVRIEFYKVAMKPGKPITFGRRGKTIVLGLPGNPASSSLTFLLFGLPIVRALLGRSQLHVAPTPAQVRVPRGAMQRKPGRTEFARARWISPGVAELLSSQASGAVTSFANASCLVRIDADVERVTDGDVVPTFPLYADDVHV